MTDKTIDQFASDFLYTSQPGSGVGGGFDAAASFTLDQERGYVKNDAGKGETMHGINKTANPDVDIKSLSEDGAKALYKTRYWDAIGGDKLDQVNPVLAKVAFDTAINMGAKTASAMVKASGGDPEKLLQLREAKYKDLLAADPGKYGQYANSWANRIADLRGLTGSGSGTPAAGWDHGSQYKDMAVAPGSATVGDFAKEFLASAVDGVGSVGQFVGEGAAGIANKLTDSEDYVGKNLAKPASTALRDSMTEGGKEARKASNVEGDAVDMLLGDWSQIKLPDNAQGWGMLAMNGFGSLGSSVIPYLGQAAKLRKFGIAIKAAEAAGDVAKVAELTAEANKIAGAAKLAGAGYEAAMTGGAAADEARANVERHVSGMKHEQLMFDVPVYAEAFNRTGDEEQARQAVINSAGRMAAVVSAPAGALGGYIGGSVIEDTLLHKGMTRLGEKTITNGAARGTLGAVGGSLIEGGQETLEKVGGNIGENIATGRPVFDDASRNSAGDALGGLIVGGPIGGVTGMRGGHVDHSRVIDASSAPGGILSRAAVAGNPEVAAQAADPFSQQARAAEQAIRDGSLIQKLRDIGGEKHVSDLLYALGVAKNPNARPEARQAAMDSINTAMGWIDQGATPDVPSTGSPFSAELTTTQQPEQPGTDLATTNQGAVTTPGMPQAFDPNTIDGEVTRVDNMIGGPKALPAPPGPALTGPAATTQTPATPAGVSTSEAPAQEVPTEEVAPPAAQEAPKQAEPAAPAATRALVQAPKVEIPSGPGTAAVRKMKAIIHTMAAKGFRSVEKRADGTFLVNHKTREEMRLDGPGAGLVASNTISEIVAAEANSRKPDTPAQIEAGNAHKPPTEIHGIPVRIENQAGSARRGISPDGKKWETTMVHHYGEIEGTRAADGDKVDAFIGPRHDSDKVFVIDQKNQDGSFDEHKVMLGFKTEEEARAGYLANYEPGWTGLGAITEMSIPNFKKWVKSPAALKPAAGYDVSLLGENDAGTNTETGSADQGAGERSGELPASQVPDSIRQVPGQIGRSAAETAADKAAISRVSERLQDPSLKLAEPTPESAALTELLNAAEAVFGVHGIAAQTDRAWDGVTLYGNIYVNVKNPQAHVARTIGHEISHTREGIFEDVRNRIWGMISESGKKIYFERYLFRREGLKYEEASQENIEKLRSEMLADFFGNRFNDKLWLKQLARQKPAMFGDFVRSWIKALDAIKSILKSLTGDERQDEFVKNIDQYIEQLDQAKQDAIEVAAAWAEQNPKMAKASRGATSVAFSSRIDQINELGNFNLDSNPYDLDSLDMVEFLQAEAQRDLQSNQATPSAPVAQVSPDPKSPDTGVSDESIKQHGVNAEAAYPAPKWKKAKSNAYQLVTDIMGLINPGQNSRITLAEEPGTDNLWGANMRNTWVGPAAFEGTGWATLQGAKDFAARFIASKDLARRGFDLASTADKEQSQRLVGKWLEMNGTEGARKFDTAADTDKTFNQIAKSMGLADLYDITVTDEILDAQTKSHAITFVNRKTGETQQALLDVVKTGKRAFATAHTEELSRSGLGSAFYQMVAEYAAAHDMQVSPDHALSGINTYRRTEQMLSAAMRTGKSNVMVPHETQRLYSFNEKASTQEEHDANIARMLLAGLRNAKELAPDLVNLKYTPITGVFTFKDGGSAEQEVTRMLSDTDARAFGLGRSTLARAVLTQQLLGGNLNEAKVAQFAEPVLYSEREEAAAQYQAIKEQYEGTEQWMKAPDGTATKLEERQWIQVRTPNFKKFFGDWEAAHANGGVWANDVSKAVSENGEPMVLFHGTDKGGFYSFNTPGGTKRGDVGIFTTPTFGMARSYARRGRLQDVIAPQSQKDLEDAGFEFGEQEDGTIRVMDVDGYTMDGPVMPDGNFATMERAVDAALKSFSGTDDLSTVYGTFANIRHPYETDFEGAMWSGERKEQWIIEDENGDRIYSEDGKSYFNEDELDAELARLDAADISAKAVSAPDHYETTDSAAREGAKPGMDGTIVYNVIDDGGGPGYDMEPTTIFVLNDPKQLKSADWNTGEFGDNEDLRFSERSAKNEDRVAVIPGARPGAFSWDFTRADIPPAPYQVPTQYEPRIEKVGPVAQKILSSSAFRDLVKDLFGIDGFKVTPLHGSWLNKPEPSFAITGDNLTFEQADGLSRLIGFAWAQDAAIVIQPTSKEEPGEIPAVFIGNDSKLSSATMEKVLLAAQQAGIDYSSSIDGKSVKFLYFGDDDGFADFHQKIRSIQQAAGLKHNVTYHVRSKLNESEIYTQQSGGEADRRAEWLNDGTSGSPDLFRRVVGTVLVPYAKAVAAEGYRFSIQRFGDRFGLSETQREVIRDALMPTSGIKKSTVAIASGAEKLNVVPTGANGKSSVSDILWALQNRSAQQGLIEPGDYSPRALKLISEAIADEVQYHVTNPRGGKSAIGWYDRALKVAKANYHTIFPELETNRDKEMLFDALWGIASQGNDVFSNSTFGARVYQLMRDGKMTLPQVVETLKGTFGGETAAIENNFLKLNELLGRNGYDAMREFFNTKDSVSTINGRLRKDRTLFFKGKPLKVEGQAEQIVTGWMVFGPKIGSFINNLHGDYSTLTADLWFSRSWNRILGYSFVHAPALEAEQYQKFISAVVTEFNQAKGDFVGALAPKRYKGGKPIMPQFGPEGKTLTAEQVDDIIADPYAALAMATKLEEDFRKGGYKVGSDLRRAGKVWVENRTATVAAPRGDVERSFQQQAAEYAQKMIKRKTGMELTIADIQAALWFYEKDDLFGPLGGTNKKSEGADYAGAAEELVHTYNRGNLYFNKTDKIYVHGARGEYLQDFDPSKVNDAAAIMAEYSKSPEGDAKFNLLDDGDIIEIEKTNDLEKNQAQAHAAIGRVASIAQARGVTLTMTPKARRGTKARQSLVDGYKALGFTEQEDGSLVRVPTAKPQMSEREQPRFYSELSKQVSGASMKQAPAGAWKSYINALNNKGVKKDEIEWSGVMDWLDLAGDKKVPKEEVVNFLNANGVQVSETVLGGGKDLPKQLQDYVDYYGGDTKTTAGLLEIAREAEADAQRFQRRGEPNKAEERFQIAELANIQAERGEVGPEATQYSQYTLPGGENYREVLLTLPAQTLQMSYPDPLTELPAGYEVVRDGGHWLVTPPGQVHAQPFSGKWGSEANAVNAALDRINQERNVNAADEWRANVRSKQYTSGHWDQKNVLAHIRVNDRTDASGAKVLHIEELQSDFGQDAKKKGITKRYKLADLTPAEHTKSAWVIDAKEDGGNQTFNILKSKAPTEQDAMEYIVREKTYGGPIPNAPFIGNTQGWLNLALKRVALMAVDGGYDKVSFVNGEQSADRYSLHKQVDEIMVLRSGDKFDLGFKMDGSYRNGPSENGIGLGRVEQLIGKEMAERISKQPEGRSYLSGNDLKMGGDGMKSFYDQIVPNAVSAMLKKLGGGKMGSVKIVREMSPAKVKAINDAYASGSAKDIEWAKGLKRDESEQPGFDVTDAMREKAAGGLPLFSKREDEAKPAPKPDHFAGKSVTVQVKIEDTGEIASLTMDVNRTLNDFAERKANLQKLLECL